MAMSPSSSYVEIPNSPAVGAAPSPAARAGFAPLLPAGSHASGTASRALPEQARTTSAVTCDEEAAMLRCMSDGGSARGRDSASDSSTALLSGLAKSTPATFGSLDSLNAVPVKQLGALGMAVLGFLSVSAGPYGLEDAMGAAGAGPVVAAIFGLAIVWALPQALVTAEMSSMIDENGGYIHWVYRAFGAWPSFFTAWNSALSNMLDLPLYPVLFAAYFDAMVPGGLSWAWLLAVKMAVVAIMCLCNLRGLKEVSNIGLVLTVLIVLPFFVQLFLSPTVFTGTAWAASLPSDQINWLLLSSTLMWNMQGWDSLSTVAGEVDNPRRTYVLGTIGALLMTVAVYTVAVVAGAATNSDWASWHDGQLAVTASRVAPWLGAWVAAGAAIAQLGNGLSMLGTSSRLVSSMAQYRMGLPLRLKEQVAVLGPVPQPRAALLLQVAITAVLAATCSFEVLVVLDTLYKNVALLFESAAFLRLRYSEPDVRRPYVVPGGLPVAWLLTGLKTIVVCASFASAWGTVWVMGVIAGTQVVLAAMYFAVRRSARGQDYLFPGLSSRPLASSMEPDV